MYSRDPYSRDTVSRYSQPLNDVVGLESPEWFSDDDDYNADYHQPHDGNDSDLEVNIHHGYRRNPRRHQYHASSDMNYQRVSVAFPLAFSPNLSREDVLILPHLTKLRARVSQFGSGTDTVVRAAVAGNMRLREIVPQLVSGTDEYNIVVYVKSRGSYVAAPLDTKLHDIRDVGFGLSRGSGEVELKIEVREGFAGGRRAAFGGIRRRPW